jgi:hypothetical protein
VQVAIVFNEMAEHPSERAAANRHDRLHTMRGIATIDDETLLVCGECGREVAMFRDSGRYLVLTAGDDRVRHQSYLAS